MVNFLKRLSFRNKVIGAAIVVFLVLLVVSIPGDRNELLKRQARVEAAQVAYELALPSVGPAMENVLEYLDTVEVDLSENTSYTGLSGILEKFNDLGTMAGQFGEVVNFSRNVKRLLEGSKAVAELDTIEFNALVTNMNTTLGFAWLAVIEVNNAIDEYNDYRKWISATVTQKLFDLPEGFDDPVTSRSVLNRTLVQLEEDQ